MIGLPHCLQDIRTVHRDRLQGQFTRTGYRDSSRTGYRNSLPGQVTGQITGTGYRDSSTGQVTGTVNQGRLQG
jgi:hypothetical protein